MTYVITQPCEGVCDTACVEVCPVDCIHGPVSKDGSGSEVKGMSEEDKKGKQLYIDPDTCIDCGLCEPECPVTAIFAEDDVPAEWSEYTQKNIDFFA
jgi:ferredoxin